MNRAEYWQKGYTVVRGFLSPSEIERLRAECDRLAVRSDLFVQNIPEADARQSLNGDPVRDRLDPVAPLSSAIRELTQNERLRGILHDILEDEPNPFKDKAIFKPPGTKGYDLHQDYAYWEHTRLPADSLLTVQISIDAADAENGATEFYPDLHHNRLNAPRNAPRDVCPSAVEGATRELIATAPGDLVIFHSLTPHRSEPNRSQRSRRTLYCTYNAHRYGDFYRSYYGDRLQI